MICQCQDIIIWLRLNNHWNKKYIYTPQKEVTKYKKKIVYHNAIKLYNTLLSIYFNDYDNITDQEKEKMGEKYSLLIAEASGCTYSVRTEIAVVSNLNLFNHGTI